MEEGRPRAAFFYSKVLDFSILHNSCINRWNTWSIIMNSIFVDAMLQENNKSASNKLEDIESQLKSIERKLDELK